MALMIIARLLAALALTYVSVTSSEFARLKSKYLGLESSSSYGGGHGSVWDNLVNAVIFLLLVVVIFKLWPPSADELSGLGPYASKISAAIATPFPGIDAAMDAL